MKKSSYQKLRNQRAKRLNNEIEPKENNLPTVLIFVVLVLVLVYFLI